VAAAVAGLAAGALAYAGLVGMAIAVGIPALTMGYIRLGRRTRSLWFRF
jgi:hypothetical protein